MDNEKPRIKDLPLSETTIPNSLAEIRRRCRDLLDENGEIALTLEDDRAAGGTGFACDAFNPYDRGP